MKAKLYKVLDQYHLYDGDKAIATTIVGNPMLLPNLSKQNCDSLFGVVDVEKLAEDSYQKHSVHDNKLSLDEQIQRSGGFIVGFKAGFNKAMELNKYKMFSEDDVNLAFVLGKNKDETRINKLINSILQPIEIDVEIEMERSKFIVDKSQRDNVSNGFNYIPKLDENKCLILRKK
jgi:hypothetical protein